MSIKDSFLLPLFWRTLASLPLLALGWHMLSNAAQSGSVFQLVAGVLLFIFPAWLITPPIAELLGMYAGSILLPSNLHELAPPALSKPRALRMKGMYQEAMSEYQSLSVFYPQSFEIYWEMLGVAIDNLGDGTMAEEIVYRAREALADAHQLDLIERRWAEAFPHRLDAAQIR